MRVYRWLLLPEREASECPGGWHGTASGPFREGLSQPTGEGSSGGQPLPLLGALMVPASPSLCPSFKGRASHKHMRLVQAFSY